MKTLAIKGHILMSQKIQELKEHKDRGATAVESGTQLVRAGVEAWARQSA